MPSTAPPKGGTTTTSPYPKHPVWEHGQNLSQRIPAAAAPALQTALANPQRCEALAQEYIATDAFLDEPVDHPAQFIFVDPAVIEERHQVGCKNTFEHCSLLSHGDQKVMVNPPSTVMTWPVM